MWNALKTKQEGMLCAEGIFPKLPHTIKQFIETAKKGEERKKGYLKNTCVPLSHNSKVVKGKNVPSHIKLGAKIRTYFSSNDEGV